MNNQAFVAVESEYFQVMLKAGGCHNKVPRVDTIASRIQLRVSQSKLETMKLLEETASTVCLSLDGWTSQNGLPMLACNLTWLGFDFTIYWACIEFLQINGSHSGENLAVIVFNALKKFKVLNKLFTITADNTDNNDTIVKALYRKMLTLYDNHLEEHQIHGQSMRFQGEKS